jgi:hypothetical protein
VELQKSSGIADPGWSRRALPPLLRWVGRIITKRFNRTGAWRGPQNIKPTSRFRTGERSDDFARRQWNIGRDVTERARHLGLLLA